MEKSKRDTLSREMRSRLMANRHGKMTGDQWKDMVVEPLVTLLILLIPGIAVLGPRLGALITGGFWFVGVGGLVVLALTLMLRAQRYARAPVRFAILHAGAEFQPFWLFWRPQTLYTEQGERLRFGKRLAPFTRLVPGERYLVYYLKDTSEHVLLSIAPTDHPDAASWQPSEHFEARFARRTRS